MSEERDQRIAELQEREQQLHELYMAAPCGHPAEKYYADELQALAQELEALYTERHTDDDSILRDIATMEPFVLTAEGDDANQLTVAVVGRKGNIVYISIDDELRVGSYYELFECSFRLTTDQAAKLRDWFTAFLASSEEKELMKTLPVLPISPCEKAALELVELAAKAVRLEPTPDARLVLTRAYQQWESAVQTAEQGR